MGSFYILCCKFSFFSWNLVSYIEVFFRRSEERSVKTCRESMGFSGRDFRYSVQVIFCDGRVVGVLYKVLVEREGL